MRRRRSDRFYYKCLSSYFEQFEIVYVMGVPISGIMAMVCGVSLL